MVYITKKTVRFIKERDKKLKEARRTGDQVTKEEYWRLRNRCVEELRKYEQEF